MKIVIELPDKENLDQERVLDYFYYKCLDEPSIGAGKFRVSIEGTDWEKKHKEVEVKG